MEVLAVMGKGRERKNKVVNPGCAGMQCQKVCCRLSWCLPSASEGPVKRGSKHSPGCASVCACNLLTGSVGSPRCGSLGWGELIHGAGSSSGAAAVLQPVGCLGQELCLTVHFLNSLGRGVTHEAEQRETIWTVGYFLLQRDVLGFVCAGDTSL